MKLNKTESLIKAATMLNKQELAAFLSQGWDNSFTAPEEDLVEEYNTLIFCMQEAYNEIASDYLPLYTTEEIVVTENKFDLNTLAKNFRDVKWLKNKQGKEESFEIDDNYLITKNGTYFFKYRYLPLSEEVINNEMQNFEGKISESAIAYGTCAYYCLRFNINDSFSLWDTKFKQSLLIAQQKTNNLYIKPRRFI